MSVIYMIYMTMQTCFFGYVALQSIQKLNAFFLSCREVSTIVETLLAQLIKYHVGVTDAGNSPWMVFEFMPHGDLAEVLRSNSRQLWKPVPGLAPLTKVRQCILKR